VALILDLAVLAIAAVVVGSLALLTWTFAVSTVHAVERGRRQVAGARSTATDAEARIRAHADSAHTKPREHAPSTDGEHTEA
jgi:hypothetical protein